MIENFSKDERELLKLSKYFKKKAESLMTSAELDESARQTAAACERLEASLFAHAENREAVRKKNENLKNIVKDNPFCPKCHTNTHLKLSGTVKHEKGWVSNKYKCRKCNIEFTWNRPNNPWDMIPFIESVIEEIRLTHDSANEGQKLENVSMITQMNESLEKLRPVIETNDKEYAEMEEKEVEMAKMIHDFKYYLQVEKLRMEAREGA
jgi:hypothetical protein